MFLRRKTRYCEILNSLVVQETRVAVPKKYWNAKGEVIVKIPYLPSSIVYVYVSFLSLGAMSLIVISLPLSDVARVGNK